MLSWHDCSGRCTHILVVHGVLVLFLATWMKPPSPPIQSFSLISSSNLVHMVHLTTSASDTLLCLLCTSSDQWRPSVSPSAAAASAWLAAILRHFWKEAEIRVPRSLSVYTHSEQPVTEWMRESQGERGSVACLPCILASRSIPTAMLPISPSSMDLWTALLFAYLFSTHWSKLPQI